MHIHPQLIHTHTTHPHAQLTHSYKDTARYPHDRHIQPIQLHTSHHTTHTVTQSTVPTQHNTPRTNPNNTHTHSPYNPHNTTNHIHHIHNTHTNPHTTHVISLPGEVHRRHRQPRGRRQGIHVAPRGEPRDHHAGLDAAEPRRRSRQRRAALPCGQRRERVHHGRALAEPDDGVEGPFLRAELLQVLEALDEAKVRACPRGVQMCRSWMSLSLPTYRSRRS